MATVLHLTSYRALSRIPFTIAWKQLLPLSTLPKMCESHIFYHLCGHVKIKTIIQCADNIEKLIASGQPINCNHQVCGDNVSDNVHIFPDICDKCKDNGIIGDVMNVPGMKVELIQAWDRGKAFEAQQRKSRSSPSVESVKKDSESDEIKASETLEEISIPGHVNTASESVIVCSASSPESRASSVTSTHSTADLHQIKSRITALRTRTERLLMKIRAQKPPTLG